MVERIEQVIGALEDFTEDLIKKIALDVTANLIETTPIDTGWARSNWVPQIGAPFLDPVGSPAAIDPSQQEQGQAAILGYEIEVGAVFITNNVPYIVRLNEGSSAQAPSGFVQLAIEKAVTEDIRSFRG